MKIFSISIIGMLVGLGAIGALFLKSTESLEPQWPGWQTNFDKRSVDLNEIKRGGPPKDGIPAIDEPKFIAPEKAASWLARSEPEPGTEHEHEHELRSEKSEA